MNFCPFWKEDAVRKIDLCLRRTKEKTDSRCHVSQYSKAGVISEAQKAMSLPGGHTLFPFSKVLKNSDVEAHFAEKPIVLEGTVVHGFGRGSKVLGTPTANIPAAPYLDLLNALPNGIFFGWAFLEDQERTTTESDSVADVDGFYEAVMSIGWNPVFKNQKKSIEAYLVHEFDRDFYGAQLRLAISGFIRLESTFESIDALKAQIAHDIVVAKGKPRSLLQMIVCRRRKLSASEVLFLLNIKMSPFVCQFFVCAEGLQEPMCQLSHVKPCLRESTKR